MTFRSPALTGRFDPPARERLRLPLHDETVGRPRVPRQGTSVPVITFDFHNTIATCDPWFALEVRDLPWAVALRLDLPASGRFERRELDDAYATLRRGVIVSGNEIDAFDAVFTILTRHGAVVDRRTVERAVDEVMRETLSSMEPVEGIGDTVRYLHNRRCRLGIVSSAVHHQFVEWSLDRLGLRDAFATVVTSAIAGYYKSSPLIYAHALRALDADAGRSVHVGDSSRWDVEGSQRAGMTAIWFDTGRVETPSATLAAPIVPELTLTSMAGAGPLIHAVAMDAERRSDD